MASGAKKAYEIEQSWMSNVGNASYLKRDYGGGANSYTKWTFSTWFKNTSENYAGGTIWGVWDNSTQNDVTYGWIGFYQDKLQIGGWSTTWRTTNRVFRDVAAWYHIVVAIDTNESTADNRIRIYINGVEETSFATKNNPSTNTQMPWNKANQHRLGAINSSTPYYLGGYLAETQLIDGSQLTPSSFGETDSETGQWIPKKYEGTYTGYSFYLPFKKNDRYSVYFDGSTSAGLQTADSSDFTFGTSNFTAEAWFYSYEDQGNTRYIIGQGPASGATAESSISFLLDSNNKLRSYIAYNGGYLDLISSTAMVENTWYHGALVRNSNTFTLYLNGTSVASTTSSITVVDSDDKMAVGIAGEYTTAHNFKGWISNVRIVNGTAVYTSNFTPSTSPLTAITNTKLLCCQDSTITTDNSGTSKTLTILNAANSYTQQMSPFNFDWYQDQSGQNMHYTANNLADWNLTLDTPTNNFATFNSVEPYNSTVSTLVTGNLNIKAATYSSGNYGNHALTIPIPESGKWYIEWLSGVQAGGGNISSVGISSGNYFGLLIPNQANGPHTFSSSTAMTMDTYSNEAHIYDGGSSVASASSLTATSYVCAIAIDVDNNKFWGGYDNGSGITWLNSGNPATGANGASHTYTNESIVYASTAVNGGNSNRSYIILNSGAVGTFVNYKIAGGNTDGKGIGNFFYTPPSGFLALCTKNLPEPSIKLPKEHFNSVGYAGTGGNQTVTGVGHEPDAIWIKNRSNSSNHQFHNTVAGLNHAMYPNLANQTEGDGTGANRPGVTNADGFTILGAAGNLNSNGDNYSAFCWKGGTNTTVSESGSGTSRINACTYSANPTAGFSIIEYTGSNDEISNNQHTKLTHGLNQGPDYVMIIQTDSGNNWCVMSSAMVGTSSGYYGYNDWHLNMDGYDAVDGGHYVSNDVPDSNYFYLGNDNLVNDDGDQYICYAWHSVPGFSKAGNYYGNGASEDGPMVYTGFRPRFVLAKRESGSGTSWFMWDRSFSDYHSNVLDVAMWASDVNGATQHAQYEIDFLSNGFKIRGENGGSNNSGSNYLYLAFADAPFKYSNAF
jgi:hypothetical protein